ncbi:MULTISPECIES: hypothetical protein [Neisseria]|nr:MULTISPECIES: hypothetical protein [Neisseria]
MADFVEKMVFGFAIALVLGCQSKADDQPYSPPPAQYAASE